jgi:hypothetical protein
VGIEAVEGLVEKEERRGGEQGDEQQEAAPVSLGKLSDALPGDVA